MFDFINFGADKIQFLLLVILRATGLFLIAPVFGHADIPRTVRLGLLILISMLLFSNLSQPDIPVITSNWQLAGFAAKELLVGLTIGLLFRVLFYGVYTAGSIMGYQMGFAMVTVFDQNLSNQVSILGQMWYVLAFLIFLSISGHHLIISAFAQSYEVIPPGFVDPQASVGEMMIKYTAYLFVIALKIVAPVTITLFLTDVALGTIAKAMPTMNVYFVGLPIKIAVGMIVIAISLPAFSYVIERAAGFLNDQVDILLISMGRA